MDSNNNSFDDILNNLENIKNDIDKLSREVEDYSKKIETIKQTHPFMLVLTDKRNEAQKVYWLSNEMKNYLLIFLEQFAKRKNALENLPYFISDEEFSEKTAQQLAELFSISDNFKNENLFDDIEISNQSDQIEHHQTAKFEYSEQCTTECEFYNHCYGYEENCIKQIFEDVLSTLTPRESRVLKFRFGFGTDRLTLEETGKEFGVSRERIRQIETKALRKLRHPPRSKKLLRHEDAIFLSTINMNNSEYKYLFCAIFGIVKSDNEVDIAIVDMPKIIQEKTIDDVKIELQQNVKELKFLQPYAEKLKSINVDTLSHLLYTPFSKLLEAFNDIEIVKLRNELNKIGYMFKSDYPPNTATSLEYILAKRIKQTIYRNVGDTELFSTVLTKYFIDNNLSICELINDLEDKSLKDSDAIAYIQGKYPQFATHLKKVPDKLFLTIEMLDLSVRSYNCLKRAGINTVKDLTERTQTDMRLVRNIDKKCITEIENKLNELGLSYKLEEE